MGYGFRTPGWLKKNPLGPIEERLEDLPLGSQAYDHGRKLGWDGVRTAEMPSFFDSVSKSWEKGVRDGLRLRSRWISTRIEKIARGEKSAARRPETLLDMLEALREVG